MRLLGRCWQESLTGAYEEPPAMPGGSCYRDVTGAVRLRRSVAVQAREPSVAVLPLSGMEHPGACP